MAVTDTETVNLIKKDMGYEKNKPLASCDNCNFKKETTDTLDCAYNRSVIFQTIPMAICNKHERK